MKKSFVVLLLLTFILIACPSGPTPITDDISYCTTAEIHLKKLECIPADKPYTAKGKSFTQFCKETMLSGINLHPRCLSQIINCNEINACVQNYK